MWLTEESPGLIYFPGISVPAAPYPPKYLGISAFENNSYFSADIAWLNLFKNCSTNYTLSPWWTNSSTGDTGEEMYLVPALDADGYPTSLTVAGIPGGQKFTYLQAWLFVNMLFTNPLPPGAQNIVPPMDLTLRFEGTGTFQIDSTVTNLRSLTSGVTISGNQIISTNPWGVQNTVTFTFPGSTPLAYQPFYFSIRALPDSSNYFRRASLVETQYVSLYDSGNIVHPRYKNALTDYGYGGYSRIRCLDGSWTTEREIRLNFSAILPQNATSAILTDIWRSQDHYTTNWPYPTGTYNVLFATGQVIPCQFTYGSSAVNWAASLNAAIPVTGDGANSPWAMACASITGGWAGRNKLSSFSWGARELPIEAIIQGCNEIGTDFWLTLSVIDQLTDPSYLPNVAALCHTGAGANILNSNLQFFSGLRKDRKLFVEVGDELWNFSYPYRNANLTTCMMGVQKGYYAAQGSNEIYGGQEFYGTMCGDAGDAFFAEYGADFGARCAVGVMNQAAQGNGTGFMKVAMNSPDALTPTYTRHIDFIGWAPYAGPDNYFSSSDVALIVGCGDPVTEVFSLAWGNIGAITGHSYASLPPQGWAGYQPLSNTPALIAAISGQPWGSLPVEFYEFGTDTSDYLSSSDPSYAAWKVVRQQVLRDTRMAYVYYDPQHKLSSYDGYLQEFAKIGCRGNQLGFIQTAPTVADYAGFGTLELITQMEGIPPISVVAKYNGQISFCQGVQPQPQVYPPGKQLYELVRRKRSILTDVASVPLSIMSPPPASVSLAYPRTAAIATSGDSTGNQSYPSIPYSGQVTGKIISSTGFFQESTYSTPVAWLGRFDVCLIGGNWEGWDGSGTYDRGLLVDAIKQITHVTGYSSCAVWQYTNYEERQTNNGNAPYNTMNPVIDTEQWLLYGAANQSGSPVADSFGGGNSTNWAVAWPSAVGSTAADQQFSPARTTATYDGQPEDLTQYAAAYFIELFLARHSSLTTIASGTIVASQYTDSRFYLTLAIGPNDDAMKAPNMDAIYTDNLFCVPQTAGYYDLQNSYGFNYNNITPTPWLLRGAQHFRARYQAIASRCYPGRTYLNVANIAQFPETYWINQSTFPTAASGLANTMHGGLLEALIGASYSFDLSYGGVATIKSYQWVVDFCISPKQVIVHGFPSSATDWQTARYTLAVSLMGEGPCCLSVAGDYKANSQMWLDEFGGNPGTSIGKGWLGNPISSRPSAAAVNGVWVRDFDNGTAICNPRGNGAQSITAAQLNTYLGQNYTYSFFTGVQNPSLNSGGAVSTINLADPDGVVITHHNSSLTPDQDFANRAAGPGVVAAWKLNSEDPGASGYLNYDYNHQVVPTYQTAVSVLSGGAVQMLCPAGRASQDLAGNWNPPGSTAFNGQGFGANSSLYVQYMCCMDRMEYNFENYWSNSPGCYNFKLSDIFTWANGGLAFDWVEITLINGHNGPFGYTAAGNYSFETSLTSPTAVFSNPPPNGQYLIQQDWLDPNQSGTAEDPNGLGNYAYGSTGNIWPQQDWFTIDLVIHIGTMNDPSSSNPVYDSTIELYQTPRNSQTRRKCSCIKLPLFYNSGYPSSVFDTIMLTPYATNNSVGAPTNAYIWYNCLIISRQPIPLPTAYIPPPVLP